MQKECNEKKMNKPLVSICMPVFNAQRFLRQTLDSLLAQDYENIEIIILDNISTDDTSKICRSYAERDPRIKYLLDDIQVDVHEGHNRVARYAKGEYFIPMCDDDIYEPTYISKLMSLMDSNEEIGLVFTDFGYVDINGKRWTKGRSRIWMNFFKSSNSRFLNFVLYMFLRCPVPMVFGPYRTAIYRKALPFVHVDGTVWNVDNIFMLRLLSMTRVACIKEVLFYYRQKDRSQYIPDDLPAQLWKRALYYMKHQARVTLAIGDVIKSASFSVFEKAILKCYNILVFTYYSIRVLRNCMKKLLNQGPSK